MALILVGTGVAFDLTLLGIEALKSCKEAFIETYTNPISQELVSGLERTIGKPIMRLERSRLESPYLIDKAKSADVCILASGDPLTATTHITLVIEARQKGVPVRVIHNSSIHSVAPARAGLQMYRFGKTASLVNPRPNYRPVSSLDVIRENQSRNLHTLVLLDTEPEPMEAKAALAMLSEFASVIVLSRAGHDDEKISHGSPEELKNRDLGRPPFTVLVPAKLHPAEQDFIDLIK
ncbi:diphthine synthase [Candidatus Micrarchaeota archaeon]|nr:diphthine synthase [Candidatus Micrarchaeota archaeon]